MMGRGKRKWNPGDWYWIVDINGNKIWGEITCVDRLGYHVAWNDLSCTIEDYPNPAQGYLDGEKPPNWVLEENKE